MQHNGDPSDAEEISVWTVIPVGFLILLVVGVVIGGILKSTSFGPGIGDIVSFDVPAVSFDQTPVTATRADVLWPASAAKTCLLRAETMANGGGSLVVEGRDPDGRGPFRVHWAGPRTSSGAEDCGRSAELLIAASDLVSLAATAGGFGVTHKRLIMSAVTLGTSASLVE